MVLITYIEHFQGISKILAIFFAPCVVIDSFQMRYVNEYAAQTMLCQSQTFPTEDTPGFVQLFNFQ